MSRGNTIDGNVVRARNGEWVACFEDFDVTPRVLRVWAGAGFNGGAAVGLPPLFRVRAQFSTCEENPQHGPQTTESDDEVSVPFCGTALNIAAGKVRVFVAQPDIGDPHITTEDHNIHVQIAPGQAVQSTVRGQLVNDVAALTVERVQFPHGVTGVWVTAAVSNGTVSTNGFTYIIPIGAQVFVPAEEDLIFTAGPLGALAWYWQRFW